MNTRIPAGETDNEKVAYEDTKTYLLNELLVTSRIVKDEVLPEPAARAIIIRSSCSSDRWGTRTQDYSYSCPLNWSEFPQSLENVRLRAAQLLVDAEGGKERKPFTFLVPEIAGPTGRKITPGSGVNLSVSPTLLGPEVIEYLQLEMVPETYLQEVEGQVDRVPLYAANIAFGKYKATTVVAPSRHDGPACILGGDFFQKVLHGQEERIHELIMPDHVRALSSAARTKKSHVLIAGAYGDKRARLQTIKDALSAVGKIGLILDEHPDIEEQTLAEKMVTYAAISRFVIVDDIAPSGHINELGICHERKFVTAVLRRSGRPSTAMQADIADEVAFIRSFDYENDSDLERTVTLATAWGDQAVDDRAKSLNRLYSSWRTPERIIR